MTEKPDMTAIMSTPEFQEILKKTVAASLAEMATTQKIPGGVDGATAEFFAGMSQTIAMAVAEISDQGTNRKRIAPEILAKREAAARRCDKLVENAREQGLTPEYRVVSKIYFGDRVIEPWRRQADKSVVAQEISWTGLPCEGLFPINKVAEEIYIAYRESIGASNKLESIKSSHGGVVAQDNRRFSVTANGLVVKGEIAPHAVVGTLNNAAQMENNNPNAPEVRVLGTIAAPARNNIADPAAAMAARAG